MTDERFDELRHLWTGAAPDLRTPPASQLVPEARRLERQLRRRDLREVLAAAVVAAFFGWDLAHATSLWTQVGDVITISACVLIVLVLRRSRARLGGHDESTSRFADRYRALLDRQARILNRAWLWYVGPLWLGLFVRESDALFGGAPAGVNAPVLVSQGVIGAVMILVIWANKKAAANLRKRRQQLGEPAL